MNHQNPRPGEWGHSEDPLQEYPDDGWEPRYAQPINISPYYHEVAAAHNEARRQHRDEQRAKKNARIVEQQKPTITPEHLWALSFGVMLLGVSVLALAFLPLDVALFPVGLALPLTAFGGWGVYTDTRRKK